jgi:hypothetical protein
MLNATHHYLEGELAKWNNQQAIMEVDIQQLRA